MAIWTSKAAKARKAKAVASDGRMPLLDHLYELRDRLIKVAVAVAVGAVVGWFLYPQIFDLLVDPYCDLQGVSVDDCRLLQTEPAIFSRIEKPSSGSVCRSVQSRTEAPCRSQYGSSRRSKIWG